MKIIDETKGTIEYSDNAKLKCSHCGQIRMFSELLSENGHRFPDPGKNNQSWQSVYYYCPCDGKNVILFDSGDGTCIKVINGELVGS